MSHLNITQELILLPADNHRLSNFCGQFDSHLRQIEQRLKVEIANRGNKFNVSGFSGAVRAACAVMQTLFDITDNELVTPEQVHLSMQESSIEQILDAPVVEKPSDEVPDLVSIKTKQGFIKGRGQNQQSYLKKILVHDINFGVGPAGTGKTYLAVACAVEALERDFVRRILLVRPAVEAGEKLGFLPGDLSQKVDPYLRPLYDALYEMLGFERVAKLIERNVIEVAPLAYMRGRTLNESFIILDEAQNTTKEQMKMFLTRLGYNSTAMITGDITQIDLPNSQMSGLRHAIEVLKDVEGIGFTFFQAKDVVRHALVQKVILAYEKSERETH